MPHVVMPNIEVASEEWAIISQTLKIYLPTLDVWVFGSGVSRTQKPYPELVRPFFRREFLKENKND